LLGVEQAKKITDQGQEGKRGKVSMKGHSEGGFLWEVHGRKKKSGNGEFSTLDTSK